MQFLVVERVRGRPVSAPTVLLLLVQAPLLALCLGPRQWSPPGCCPPPSRLALPMQVPLPLLRPLQVLQWSNLPVLVPRHWLLPCRHSQGLQPHRQWQWGWLPLSPLLRIPRPWFSLFQGFWESLGHWWPKSKRGSSSIWVISSRRPWNGKDV